MATQNGVTEIMSKGRVEAEFSPDTRRLIAMRAGYKCSLPLCNRLTLGPAAERLHSTCRGVAAHIYSAAAGGPRGTGGLTSEERSSSDNGIWVCENHGRLIDNNRGTDYSPALLLSYKALHEARIARELDGVSTPFGWLQSMKVHSSSVFAGKAEFSFGKLTLVIGANGSGKTALCQWLASLAHPRYLERWQKPLKNGQPLAFEVKYLDPHSHTAGVSFIDSDFPRYERDSVFSAIPTTPIEVIFPSDLEFYERPSNEGKQDDLKLLADTLKLHPYEVLALCDQIPKDGTGHVKRIWFEKDDDGIWLYADVKGTVPGLPLRNLSGGECVKIVMELAILAAKRKAETKPTVILLDHAWRFDSDWLKHYGELLSSPSFGFQTVACMPMREINLDELRWVGWKVIRLKGQVPSVTVSEEIRE
jgi:hypothetical protein